MCKTITSTLLWNNSLAHQEDDQYSAARERLRSTFWGFRNRVALLVNETHRYLPEFTVHDISHLDSLWEIADTIVGVDYPLTPTEAFVFGGAILLHDAGLSLFSFPEGLESLQQRNEWNDLITNEFRQRFNRFPTKDEQKNPPEAIKKRVISQLLRMFHAEQAETLAALKWKLESEDDPIFLIDDQEIRVTLGRIIGRIAHSHWWDIDRVEKEFTRSLGSPYWCPSSWTIDPMKIACLLRSADVAHVDARRAPNFLHTLRRPSNSSNDHWEFQKRLQKPHLSDDALVYTSGYAFPFQEASSWWLCLDSLTTIDRELRQVDALLADKGIPRFAARRVAGIESPERLVTYVPTDNWLPVNAVIQVSDVPKIIKTLGGSELYGNNPTIPLRELIQNSVDAINARRLVEKREKCWGEIYVRLGKDEHGDWLEVQDNGIGMSSNVLTNHLLDFGGCYWESSQMIQEFPGLLSSGFEPIGKFGIGFFSIFMLGESIRIRTRRSDAAQSETLILEIGGGFHKRPILRNANPNEFLRDGGTCVRVWLNTPPEEKMGLLKSRYSEDLSQTLTELCRYICPNLDVNVTTEYKGKTEVAVRAMDWLELDGLSFFSRIEHMFGEGTIDLLYDIITKAAKNLKNLYNEDDEIVGRACIVLPHSMNKSLSGVVTVGGLVATHTSGIAGILVGDTLRAGRDYAIPKVPLNKLSEWANEQAFLLPNLYDDPKDQMECASIVSICGGNPGPLPIAYTGKEWITYNDIAKADDLPDELLLLWDLSYEKITEHFDNIQLYSNVFIGDYAGVPVILQTGQHYQSWPEKEPFLTGGAYSMVQAAAQSWDVPIKEVLKFFIKKKGNYQDRVIGLGDGREIRENVRVIQNPLRYSIE